jgi:hypothetical protein
MMASPSSRFFSSSQVAKSSLAVRMTTSKYGAISVPGNSNPRISYSEIKSCTAANSAPPRGFAAQLRAKTLDVITTEDVLRVLRPIWTDMLRPIWTDKAETPSRLLGRIERILDAAKARNLRSGDNPAEWKGNLKRLLAKRDKNSRGHHSARPRRGSGFCPKSAPARGRRASGEFAILSATRTSDTLGAKWPEIDLEKRFGRSPRSG